FLGYAFVAGSYFLDNVEAVDVGVGPVRVQGVLAVARPRHHGVVIPGRYDVRREQELALGRAGSAKRRKLGDLPGARSRVTPWLEVDAPDIASRVRRIEPVDIAVGRRSIGADAIEQRDVGRDGVVHVEQLAGIALAGVAAPAAFRLPDDAAVECIEDEDPAAHAVGGRRLCVLVERTVRG